MKPLYLSLQKLKKFNVPFVNTDSSPRTIAQKEYFSVEINGENLEYEGQGYWEQNNYMFKDEIQLLVNNRLFEEYAKQWAVLHPVMNFTVHGEVLTDEFTKWKNKSPSFQEWLKNHPIYSKEYTTVWDYKK